MLEVQVRNERQQEKVAHAEGPLLIGRAPEGEGRHLVIEDLRVSRRQLRVSLGQGGRVFIENLGKDLRLADGEVLTRGNSQSFALPLSLRIGHTTLELTGPSADLHTIAPPVSATTVRDVQAAPPSVTNLASLGQSPAPEVLTHWFETLLSVQAAAANSDAFHEQTARALVELVGLDRGLVLKREGNDWGLVAGHSRDGQSSDKFSRTVLREVLSGRRTYFDSPRGADLAQSLLSLECVVASPIFGPDQQVVGVVYGSRDLRRAAAGQAGISNLEAQVVQLLAGAVSAGLSRVEQEEEAARLRVQFEQFFSPALASELERNPRLLDANEREITVLFSDVRGFSAIAEQLGARRTYELVGDLLDRLTKQVLEHGGVVVDYYGDGLEAMWNAPTDQPDHSLLASRAALAMQAEMPGLNETWGADVGRPLRVGIGLHRGTALVGNAGSKRRMKYGPRGHVVNLASRVESATKKLGARVLVTDAVRAGLGEELELRRLGPARVAGIDELVGLHELGAPEDPSSSDVHARVLEHFEAERFEEAIRAAEGVQPGAALSLLLESAARGQASGGAAFDLSRK
jgi:adenylate cyclase